MSDIIDVHEAEDIKRSLGILVDAHLPQAVFAFTSGSVPYGAAVRGRSDIDVNVVLPTSIVCDDSLVADINRFIDALTELHAQHGLNIDRRYPGEYFTTSQARDAVTGRGVPIREGMPDLPPHPDDDYWEATEETWYLAWLGALTFSHHAAGEIKPLMLLRSHGWRTILLLCLNDLVDRQVTRQAILDRLMQPMHPSGGFGVNPGYRRFADLEARFIDENLTHLGELGYLRSIGNGSYTVQETALRRWQTKLSWKRTRGYEAPNLFTVSSSKRLAR